MLLFKYHRANNESKVTFKPPPEEIFQEKTDGGINI